VSTILSLILTAAFGAGVLALLGASPLTAYRLIAAGAFGTPERLTYVLTAWTPLLLCTAGLFVTFATGLWNIGIEGQVVLGAVFTTGVLRALEHGSAPWAALLLAGGAAVVGGAAWGMAAGALRVSGNVHEIFGGLGLNFIAGSLTVYLVLGPWARPGIASTSGTLPFPSTLWLPVVAVGPLRIPGEVVLALLSLGLVRAVMRGTQFGLRLAAIGKSPRAAFLRGVPIAREMLSACALCGGLAGLAGFVLVASAYSRHQLFPLISGGDGFLAILVALLANRGTVASLLISFFFAAISTGSLQLPLQMQLDSSLSGVIEGMLVLLVLLTHGLGTRLARGGR
jgi:general nucleoside transport system permease protein